MTVLLVDDQIRILSGLISGLDWDALEVSSIRTATNAAQAKIILQEEHVDILLCDIEMPGENGPLPAALGQEPQHGLCLRVPHLPRGLPLRQGGHPAELLRLHSAARPLR